MGDRNDKPKAFLESLREELAEHCIKHEKIALLSHERQLNGGEGYSVDQVRNFVLGRTAMAGDIANLMVEMIEASMKEKERSWQGDIEVLSERLSKMTQRRIDLAQNFAA